MPGSERLMSALPQLHTPEAIADSLQVSTWWVKEQARKGRVDAVKAAGAWRFTDEQYAQLLALHTTTAVPEEPDVIAQRRRPAAPAATLQLVARLPRRQAASI
ncbi:DNA-binding protein [Streptomyces sp. NPDC057136]|uniref:DNA-binding protein n=1 Tax=Streptomyces sp. NPDC057136 TaxID=3346029 RepID=UPI003637D0F7